MIMVREQALATPVHNPSKQKIEAVKIPSKSRQKKTSGTHASTPIPSLHHRLGLNKAKKRFDDLLSSGERTIQAFESNSDGITWINVFEVTQQIEDAENKLQKLKI